MELFRSGGLDMSRKWLERVQDYPRLRSGWLYPLCVVTVEKVRKSAAIGVRFEYLDAEQAGALWSAYCRCRSCLPESR